MKLLSQDELERSPAVASNRMNRERGATGVNSYERDLWLSPVAFLSQRSPGEEMLAWLDIGCGKAKALIQTAHYFAKHFPARSFHFTGVYSEARAQAKCSCKISRTISSVSGLFRKPATCGVSFAFLRSSGLIEVVRM